MKLMTINTHSILEENYIGKMESFVKAVAQLQPDIITMQEVNQTADAPKAIAVLQLNRTYNNQEPRQLKADNHAAKVAEALRKAGIEYNWTWLPMKLGYSMYDEGMAVFCRKPIAETNVVLLSSDGDYGNWRTRYALGIRPAGTEDWFYTIHMGWWNDEEEPFGNQWEKLQTAVKEKNHQGKIFLMGDFNSPAQIRHEGYDLIKESGWQDTYLLAEKKDAGNTVRGVIDGWRDKLSQEDMLKGMRIDHIWCSEMVKVRSSRTCFDGNNEPVVSDHFGLLIDVED